MKNLKDNILLLLLAVFTFSGCNMEDDVAEIFTEGEWRYSYTCQVGKEEEPYFFEYKPDDYKIKNDSKVIEHLYVKFELKPGSYNKGRFSIYSSDKLLTCGTWRADGKSHKLACSIEHDWPKRHTNVFINSVMEALNKGTRWGGDTFNLYISYGAMKVNFVSRK